MNITQVNVTQEVLRAVAKLSNFNVELEARHSPFGTMYRAICTDCREATAIGYEVVQRGASFDGLFETFCQEHRHEVEIPVVKVEGRKFKCLT